MNKNKLVLLIPLLAFVLVGCSKGSNTDAQRPTSPEATQKRGGLIGKWKVLSRSCAGKTVPIAYGESARVDNTSTYIAYVTVNEDDPFHQCKHVDGFQFQLMSADQENHNGIISRRQAGIMKYIVIRDICWQKQSGTVNATPYKDQTHDVQGQSSEAQFLMSPDGILTLKTLHPQFCNEGSSEITFSLVNQD